ncbi:MAG: hypothetical protein SFW65_04180 [Alphaproteobacteria bacterium]|nr:hypothetical protein [Alphaproteobacteria bacterium]
MSAAQKIALLEEQIIDAGTLTLKRISDGGLSITANGKPVATCLRSDVFAAAITDLVYPEIDVTQVARVELTPVAPQVMFTEGHIPRFYNVAVYSTDNVRLGERDGLRHQEQVVTSLAAKLAL